MFIVSAYDKSNVIIYRNILNITSNILAQSRRNTINIDILEVSYKTTRKKDVGTGI